MGIETRTFPSDSSSLQTHVVIFSLREPEKDKTRNKLVVIRKQSGMFHFTRIKADKKKQLATSMETPIFNSLSIEITNGILALHTQQKY